MRRRDELLRLLAAHEAAAGALRRKLDEEARQEYAENGCRVTWEFAHGRVAGSLSTGGIKVDDVGVLTEWVASFHPEEIETVQRVRNPAWLDALLKTLIEDEEGVIRDPRGRVVEGVKRVPGGQYVSTSVTIDPAAKKALARAADEYADGRKPIELEGVFGVH